MLKSLPERPAPGSDAALLREGTSGLADGDFQTAVQYSPPLHASFSRKPPARSGLYLLGEAIGAGGGQHRQPFSGYQDNYQKALAIFPESPLGPPARSCWAWPI